MQYTSVQVKRNEENFPVASFLLPGKARALIRDFYQFARMADDIADSPTLSPDVKTTQLRTIRTALERAEYTALPDWAQPYAHAIHAGNVSASHGIFLLDAFIQDATCSRYSSWEMLLDYCNRSAAPVGRMVLEACGEATAALPAADALCNLLQILNHVQDCKKDYLTLNRIYIPEHWFDEAGTTERALADSKSSAAMHSIRHRALDACTPLLQQAATLPATIGSLRLRLEIATIYEIAQALHALLYQRDPLMGAVKLSHVSLICCALRAVRHI